MDNEEKDIDYFYTGLTENEKKRDKKEEKKFDFEDFRKRILRLKK